MKTLINNGKYDVRLETSDWRYSASIIGLIKYFDYHISMGLNIEYNIDHDAIEYSSKDITEERYLLFVEYYFSDYMNHRIVEQILSNEDLTDEQIKFVNKKLKLINILKEFEFNGKNREQILEIINNNRVLIIKEGFQKTYGENYKRVNTNWKELHKNFIANRNSLLSERGKGCRLQNYYIDKGKKSKSVSYNWNYKTYNYEDEIEFDFIPFAFSKSKEAFFINNNYSIDQLIITNTIIEDSSNSRSTLFKELKNSSNFINFDAEVIIKDRDNDYFETLFIRKDTIKIFEKIEDYKVIQSNYKIIDNHYINLEKNITENILNKVKLDSIIEMLLKLKFNYGYNISVLIKINNLIYGGDAMNKEMKSAYASAKEIVEKLPENKVNSYRQKLISTITFKDYDKFCEILLQLSSYSGVVLGFAYNLFSDFECNKNLAYTFINTLNKKSNKKSMEEINNE